MKIENYDTYGCNYCNKINIFGDTPPHYSGNFFWVNSNYLKKLDLIIGENYNDPEFWLFKENPNYYNAYSSGFEGMGHYNNLYPMSIYKK